MIKSALLRAFSALVIIAFSCSTVLAQSAPLYERDAIHQPVIAAHGMVASQEAVASQVGADILKKGGNAVDAAVAVGFALAVTLPRAGNLAGGGFMMVYLAKQHKTVAIDYREMAPAAANPNIFLDANGNVDIHKARFSRMSSGVPGTVAGLAHALKEYGTMSLKQVMEPAIHLAENGIIVTYDFAAALNYSAKRLAKDPASAAILLHEDGSPYRPGEIFKNPELAKTLRMIADQGPDVFYHGKIAHEIAAEMAKGNGIMTLKDLNDYKVIERKPLVGHYHGYDIVTMPPPSSGGVHIIQMLNILTHFPISQWGFGSAKTMHAMAETMKLAYADRSKYLGDPEFYHVPVKGLTSQAYADKLAKSILPDRARPASEIAPGNPMPYESHQTTHFSIMDSKGDAVSNTYTLNFSFGSGITVPGTGILMNNEMDDFSAKPGFANAYGLLGGTANKIEGHKRPLSSMTPTIVFKDGKPYLVTGSPGGSTIITIVLQTILNVVDHRMNVADAVAAPRMHDQWFPDKLMLEPGFSPDTIAILRSMGYNVVFTHAMGSANSIVWHNGLFYGAADPRRPAAAAIGY